MKKITLFLALMVTMVTTAFAQFTQTMAEIKSDVAQLSSVPEAVTANMSSSDGYVDGACVVKSYSCDVTVATAGDVTVNFKYTGGSHGLVILGVDLLNANGEAVYYEYANGRTPVRNNSKETYTLSGVAAGDYVLRYIFCHRATDHEVGNQQADITVTNAVLKKTLPEGVLNNVDDLSNTALYTIVAQDTNRGALYARTSDNYLTSTGKQGKSIDAADPDQQFMFIKKGAKTYLYSVGAGKCVNDEGSNLNLTESRNHYVVVEKQGTGYMKIKMNGSDLINISNGRDYGTCADYNSVDGGNVFTITKVGEASASVISAALATDFAPVDVAKRYYLETTVGNATKYLKFDPNSSSDTKTSVVSDKEDATVFAFENVVDGYNKYYTLSTGEGSSKMYIETSHNWNITANTSGSNVWLEQESETSITYFINNPKGYLKAQDNSFVYSDGNNSNRSAWSLVEKLYTITYKVDGVVTSTEQFSCGAAITPMAAPTKDGHTFSGWSTIPATMPASDVVIEGTFAVNNYTVTYLVDGQQFTTATVAYGAEIPALENQPVKAGHTFKGWANVPETMPAENVTLTAEFEINSYTVTYLVDGEEFTTATVAYGAEIPALENQPVKAGHTFKGWANVPETMPAENVTLNAEFTVNSYTVTYLVDGEEFTTATVAYGAEIPALENQPSKVGYTFNGWGEVPATMPAEDVTLNAEFTVNNYTVTYLVDGEEFTTATVVYGAAIPALEEQPVKEGYTFIGWGEIPSAMPAANVTLTAEFTVNSYTVTYLADDKEFTTATVVYGEAIPALTEQPEKEGYTFIGWGEIPSAMPASNVTLNAVFEVNYYTITYYVDGEVYDVQTVAYGAEIMPLQAPEKICHTFNGWSNMPTVMPADNVEVYAMYGAHVFQVVYMVDDNIYAQFDASYGSPVPTVDDPVKVGYTFEGWGDVPSTVPANGITLHAKFTPNTYVVRYVVDNITYKMVDVEYGSIISLIPAPEKEGYTFSGWSEFPATMPAKEVVIEGSFTVNSYSLVYKVDGEVYETLNVEYGSALTAIAAPEKEGHTFSGWSTLPETMPAEEVVIEGTFTVNSYSLVYKVDGEVYETIAVEFGSELTAIEAPEKEGYTFSGWSTLPSTMPAKEVVISGSFTINTYTVTFIIDNDETVVELEYGAEIELPSDVIWENEENIPATMPAENIVIKGAKNTTNIKFVNIDAESVVYDLNGQRIIDIENIERGIYIINGKKVYVK